MDDLLARLDAEPNLQILTANAALARELTTSRIRQLGGAHLVADRILDIDGWLQLWAQDRAGQRQLTIATPSQMRLLWRRVVAAQTAKIDNFDAQTFAPLALTAWRRSLLWQLDRRELAALERYNPLAFADWCDDFEKRMQQLGLTTLELLLSYDLAEATAHRSGDHPLVLVKGADTLAPLISTFLGRYFTGVEECHLAGEQAQCFAVQLADERQEARAAAQWAGEHWAENPRARIAIICADSRLEPAALVAEIRTSLGAAVPLHLGFALPLNRDAVVHVPLLLDINRLRLMRSTCRAFIQNPFWARHPEDLLQRSRFESLLCDTGQPEIGRRLLLNLARQSCTDLNLDRGDDLSGRIERALQRVADPRGARPLLDWIETFDLQLRDLGWPGLVEADQDPLERVEKWYDLCADLAALAPIAGNLNLDTALDLLASLCSQLCSSAQPAAPGVNLIDTVESAIGFDHVWLTGADDRRWPGAVQPNPLIPIELQLRHQMPRADPERERNLALQLLDGLSHQCRTLVFSLASAGGREDPSFSTLLPDHTLLQPRVLAARELPPDRWMPVDCARGPALRNPERARGGARLLSTVAASPFSAFAQYRLGATPLGVAVIGLNSMQLGILVHSALQYFWNRVRNSDQLQSMSQAQRESAVGDAALAALDELYKAWPYIGSHYRQCLLSWLQRLLLLWLDTEQKRDPFAVEATEKAENLSLGPLGLRIKIDRVDRLANGELLLIDYKTGTLASPADLISSPPQDAQLPLYALTSNDTLAAVCSARVNLDKPGFAGVGAQAILDGVKAQIDWPGLRQQWQNDLQLLAVEYSSGKAQVREIRTPFGRLDDLAPLHRFDEYDALMDWYETR